MDENRLMDGQTGKKNIGGEWIKHAFLQAITSGANE